MERALFKPIRAVSLSREVNNGIAKLVARDQLLSDDRGLQFLDDIISSMDALAKKLLSMFASFNKEALDLHELFEAGGNDPEDRAAVLDTVERLVKDGLVEERGNDFYALTKTGIGSVHSSD